MIRPDAVERFGLLTEAIQVKGAIALADISRRGMHVDGDRLLAVRARYRQELDALVARILREPGWEGLLSVDRAGDLELTPKGRVPRISQKRLCQLLEAAAAEVAAATGRPVPLPRTDKGNLSCRADDWQELAPLHPFVAAWLELGRIAKMLQFVDHLDGAAVHPRYATLVRTGRTSASNPNIQNLPRQGGIREVFRPAPGHVFLMVDYAFIELRTLAAECEARYGSSRLAEVIRDGVDPHCFTAAMFEGLELGAFMALKGSESAAERGRYGTLRQRAKVLNFGIPGGLGARALVAYAKSTYDVTLTLEEGAAFRRRLIEDVYPELGTYLADDGMEILARNLGASVPACWARLAPRGGRPASLVGAVRKIVRGEPRKADGTPYGPRFVSGVWGALRALNRVAALDGPLERRVGGEELCRRLFRGGVETLTGRIRGRVSFTQARNTPFQGLAADGAKLALWDLVREGYRVVAFVHDEVVIELPEDADADAEAYQVETIMCRSMEQVTGRVPVACESVLARCWSKAAKRVVDPEGRLIPWEPAHE